MDLEILRWRVHRRLVDTLGVFTPFSRSRERLRVLFLSERDPIPHAQLFPFHHHRAQLAARHRVEFRELPLARLRAGQNPYRGAVDAVCLQTWYDLGPDAMAALVERLRAEFPGARLAYLDWFAPTDLRYAEVLDGAVSAYVKKQVLRDRAQYGRPTLGDTNLTDFCARRYHLELPRVEMPVPPSFWDKLVLGPNFVYSAEILPLLRRPFPERPRDIDLHARIAVKGTEWYRRMRQEALDRALALEPRMNVACRGFVARRAYLDELFRSKLCFSPFGYGEVCWRDFEAMATGAVLLKPDMSHLACSPDVFVPGETYVPLAWDLSDLEEKVARLLARPDEREAIARRARARLEDYFREDRFSADVAPLFDRLAPARSAAPG